MPTRPRPAGTIPFDEKKPWPAAHQFVSTDFPEPRLDLSPYQVRFTGGIVARANPVIGDSTQPARDFERVADAAPRRSTDSR